MAYHALVVRSWLIGMYGPMKLVTRKSTQLGSVLSRRSPTGEVLSVSASDTDEFGGLTQIVSEAVGAFIATLVIAGLVLSTSVPLGLLVLVAAPLIVVLVVPLLRPLQRREEVERTRVQRADRVWRPTSSPGCGSCAASAASRPSGATTPRSPTGPGGRASSAGLWQAAVDSAGVLLSGLFLVLLVWLGTRSVIAGDLSVGELVSFAGYAVFMIWPVQSFFTLAQKWIRSVVSARKAVDAAVRGPALGGRRPQPGAAAATARWPTNVPASSPSPAG